MPSLIYIVSLSTSELYTIPIDLLAFNQKMGMEMTDESRLKKNVQLSYWSSSLLCCARSHFHTARIFDISKICRSHKILIIRIQINCSRECEMLGTTLRFVQKSASKLVYIYIWYLYIIHNYIAGYVFYFNTGIYGKSNNFYHLVLHHLLV